MLDGVFVSYCDVGQFVLSIFWLIWLFQVFLFWLVFDVDSVINGMF